MRTIERRVQRSRAIATAFALLLAAVACESSVGPDARGPLRGMQQVSASDSAGAGVPQPLSPIGAGAVVGTVIGPPAPGAGNDSLRTAPRVAGVTIRIYAVVGEDDPASPALGPVIASVTTDANGRFETPVIESTSLGHVLTFTPPVGSGYAAAWTRTQFWSGSSLTPWWVTVPRAP